MSANRAVTFMVHSLFNSSEDFRMWLEQQKEKAKKPIGGCDSVHFLYGQLVYCVL